MKDRVILPQWLDDLIFEQLGAKYCRSKGNMAVIDWDKSDVLNYLGTYFPRSYTESYCIFEQYFRNESALWKNKEEISLFDFGCGTGGEIFGLLTAIVEHCKSIKRIKILALDGNKYSLRLYENIMELFKTRCSVDICNAVLPIKIEDIYDFSIVETVVDSSFDIIMSFKVICINKMGIKIANIFKGDKVVWMVLYLFCMIRLEKSCNLPNHLQALHK